MRNFLSVLVLSTLVASQALAGSEAFMTVRGVKQGQFKGETPVASHKDAMAVLNFNYEITSPRDPASGLPTGKRMHKPVVITKEWGAASPQLLTAVATNEALSSVVIEFYEAGPEGKEVLSMTVKLTNASVSDIKQSFGTLPGATSSSAKNLQDVSFTFQKIEITDRSGTTYTDDWSSPVFE